MKRVSDLEGAAQAIGRIPSGLFIVTTGDLKTGTGYLASFVQQVSLDPMIITIGVGKSRPAVDMIRASGHFAVHILSEKTKHFVKHFVRGFDQGRPAFTGIAVEEGVLGTPILVDSFAVVECELLSVEAQPGDHVLFFGKAIGGSVRSVDASTDQDKPVIHVRSSGRKY